jgi:hypothetical protein
MKRALVPSVLAFKALICCATPCSGVDRTLSENDQRNFATAIERHLNKQLGPTVNEQITTSPQDVLQVFRLGAWHIVYVNTHVSDEPFLFYDRPPHKSAAYITAWAGGAATNEAPRIRNWLIKNAPGIPKKLANCFAWHVTNDRDM